MAKDFSLVEPVQYPTQKPSTARSDFDKFINNTVEEYGSLAQQLTKFRQKRAEAQAKGDTAREEKADQKIQKLHSRVEQLNDEIQPVLDAMNQTRQGLPRRGL